MNPREATRLLVSVTAQPGHHFWPDALELSGAPEFSSVALAGHRQVTDAYLIGLARDRKGKLSTLDQGLAALVADNAERRKLIEVVSE